MMAVMGVRLLKDDIVLETVTIEILSQSIIQDIVFYCFNSAFTVVRTFGWVL